MITRCPNRPARRAPLSRLARALKRGWRREEGTATVEFVIAVPVMLMIFMASIESGLLMTRYIMLERGVDTTIRELRLGRINNPTYDKIKTEICDRAVILQDCANTLRLELQPISTVSWTFPAAQAQCINRSDTVQPALTYNPGVANQIMLVRVCALQDAIFPTSLAALPLALDSQGGYGLLAASAYVNEP